MKKAACVFFAMLMILGLTVCGPEWQAAKAEARSGDGLNKSLGGQLPLAVC